MIAKTTAQRVAETEQRKREAGLKRVCVWIHPKDGPAVRAYAQKLTTQRNKRKPKDET